MSIFKRGNIWWYEFTFKGKRYTVTSKSRNKDVCSRAQREHRRRLELQFNNLPEIVAPILCRVAMRKCREFHQPHWAINTRKMHENSQRQHLEPFFGTMMLSDIRARDINKYQRLRLEEGASNRTVNIEVSLLRLTMRKHKLWSNIAEDVQMLRENKDIGRELTDDEVDRLLTACRMNASRALYPAVLISMHTGLRNQELRLLSWRQVDLGAATIMVGKSKTKGGEGRVIPLSQTALQLSNSGVISFQLTFLLITSFRVKRTA